jgi:hypothetical protein
LGGAGAGDDLSVVPLSVDVMAGTDAASRLLLLDDRKVDLPTFFFSFLSDDSAGSAAFPFRFSSFASGT